MQDHSRNTQPDPAPPRRDRHILVATCFLAIIACGGAALAVPNLLADKSASTTAQPPSDAQAIPISAAGGDPSVPKASVALLNSDTAGENQPPTF